MPSAVVDVVEEVRARVLPGVNERTQVRHLVEDVVAVSGEATSALDIETITDRISGYGALQPLFDDSSIEEIWINDPARVFVARNGRTELTSIMMTADEVRSLVERMLASSGRRVDISNPFVDATLTDGSRLHVAIPDVTRNHWSINVRKFVMGSKSLQDLVTVDALTAEAADFLTTCVEEGRNIVVAGATQAGKTTLMNALLNSALASDRIITCEEVFELQLTSPDWVALQTRQASLEGGGEIPLRRLIKEALRMRPTRLVVGEVRQEECLDLLVAMNSGMPSMCSIHANSARETLKKLCLLPMLAGSNVAADFVIPTIASVVDIIVHVRMRADGKRGVECIAEISGRVENDVIEMHEVFIRREGQLVRR
jgi:pilus assembly protein CpaF